MSLFLYVRIWVVSFDFGWQIVCIPMLLHCCCPTAPDVVCGCVGAGMVLLWQEPQRKQSLNHRFPTCLYFILQPMRKTDKIPALCFSDKLMLHIFWWKTCSTEGRYSAYVCQDLYCLWNLEFLLGNRSLVLCRNREAQACPALKNTALKFIFGSMWNSLDFGCEVLVKLALKTLANDSKLCFEE